MRHHPNPENCSIPERRVAIACCSSLVSMGYRYSSRHSTQNPQLGFHFFNPNSKVAWEFIGILTTMEAQRTWRN
jgi:hypothetical protein